MVINFHRTFQKELKKLAPKLQDRIYERIRLFALSPYDELLHNHPLKGKYKGYRSINISGDFRAVYKILDWETVVFVRIGTHGQLYT